MTRVSGGYRLGRYPIDQSLPLIVLPGMEGDARVFLRQAPLARRRAVFAYDLLSDCASLDQLGGALLARIRCERFAVFGASLGGLVGWAMSLSAPQRVAALITLGTLPGPQRISATLHLQRRLVRRAPEKLFSRMYRRRIRRRMVEEGVPESIINMLVTRLPGRAVVAARLEMVSRWGLTAAPPVPTMWLRGQFDRESPWTTAQASQLLPRAFVETVPGGHRAHLTHPTALHGVMEHFLKLAR